MGKFSMSRFFGIDDDYETDEQQVEPSQEPTEPQSVVAKRPRHDNKVVSINAPRPGVNKISLYEPRLYSDVQEIASQLLANQAVIVNFSRIDDATARRIVDFLTGTVYAIDGDIERIGNPIFLCTPHNFEISGDLSASINETFK
ncbi:cell division protein SepF [Secundilactobacillus similis]|uniref:Cell division protein SepF n=1 Tax=Secundilactobacillus similis DSM 23365 = JCM 2765 TaxID=1423804 RepID=A0A0R2FF28_9LACO|nr:cell division protein SepF [Secundilactobacillus similis]KRN26214.1 cell division protein [Secundilactobacillus similis DSM 23365 = JCM 2765]